MRTRIFSGLLIALCASQLSFADEVSLAPLQNSMVIVAEGGGSFPTMGGGAFGGGGRFEYGFSRYVSIIVPVEYRYVSMGGFSESSTFRVMSAGVGGKLYLSQFLWPQNLLSGMFVEVHTDFGYAIEESGNPGVEKRMQQRGFAFALAGAIGYSHAFDFGLAIGGRVKISGRSFASPIQQRGMIAHPNPELLAQLGWAF